MDFISCLSLKKIDFKTIFFFVLMIDPIKVTLEKKELCSKIFIRRLFDLDNLDLKNITFTEKIFLSQIFEIQEMHLRSHKNFPVFFLEHFLCSGDHYVIYRARWKEVVKSAVAVSQSDEDLIRDDLEIIPKWMLYSVSWPRIWSEVHAVSL